MIRLFNHYLSVRTLLLTALEAAVLFQAVLLGSEFGLFQPERALPLREAGVFTVVMMLMMASLGLYEAKLESMRLTLQRLTIAYGLSLLLVTLFFRLYPTLYLGRDVFAVTSLLAFAGIALVRVLFTHVTDLGLPHRRILVVGNGPECEEVIRFLHTDEQRRSVKFAGMYPVTGERDAALGEPRANHAQLLRTIRELDVSEIVVAVRERRGGVLPLRQLLEARLKGVRVLDLTSFYEQQKGVLRIDNLYASWLIYNDGLDRGMTRDAIKRLFDVVASAILLVLCLPLWLAAMFAIMLESGYPVLRRDERVGQGGRRFTMYTLRTTRLREHTDIVAALPGSSPEPVTKVGRVLRALCLHELPKLLNVLRGEMSFVGPHPERPFFTQQLVEDIPFYDVRHSVKPGITGWARVRCPYGRSAEHARAALEYDLYYVKNHSLFLDLLILVDTLQVVVLGKGVR